MPAFLPLLERTSLMLCQSTSSQARRSPRIDDVGEVVHNLHFEDGNV
jgi:hypothetical protein